MAVINEADASAAGASTAEAGARTSRAARAPVDVETIALVVVASSASTSTNKRGLAVDDLVKATAEIPLDDASRATAAMEAFRGLVCASAAACMEASEALGVTVMVADEPIFTSFSPPPSPPPPSPPSSSGTVPDSSSGNLNKVDGVYTDEDIAIAVALSVGGR
eukprot:scaffold71639_cov45-Phaeocystis_antarctica.AAC.1